MSKAKVVVTERNQQYTDRLKKLLEADDIFQPVSSHVQILEAHQWHLCWVNSSIRDGINLQDFRNVGYIDVEKEELIGDMRDIGAVISPEGKIVRGPRGEEILMKVPQWYWDERQKKKTQRNIELTFDKARIKNAVLSAVGSEHGEEAANFVRNSGIDIQDARERVNLDE